MSLSVASRRRCQTTTTTSNPSTTTPSSSSSSSLYPVRKQHSLIDPPSHAHSHGVARYSAQQRGYLSRGLSVGRSIESIRQKLYPSSSLAAAPPVAHLGRQSSLAGEGRLAPTHTELSLRLRESSLVAWSSQSSLLKASLGTDNAQAARLQAEQKEAQAKAESAKADKNRINLNIVLAQTIRATNEREHDHEHDQDHDHDHDHDQEQEQEQPGLLQPAVLASSEGSVSSALTVQRRPPLVRAMSAPVRLDESSKSVIGGANKRNQQKLRRRKIFTRAASSVAVPPDASPLLSSDVVSNVNVSNNNNNKKQLSRARSVIAPDVITLVSLLSSEGSDSEREESSSTSASTSTGNEKSSPPTAQRSPQRRAPLLRKTGKSVSFQDSYPPTFQLASKEYSHMIRRGSIAPLAARIRANRPPTAPPVSIFLSDPAGKPMESRQRPVDADVGSLPADEAKKENNAANCNVQQQQQITTSPLYVCSIKERECWKLHQKMSAKGVSVSYETVLRGMLTPTEFRHFQKQREHEEAKAQEAAEAEAEAAAAAEKDNVKKPPATAIERLSESLLQGK
ncbi:LOW QUALITY PROTEIN: uncharacterized protein LOC132792819 [Drosophila nasuta]|uniref:LOW QUALITY PROTEIN: uncharacterized protein LOC132792819 n=1 Tax=Drosophila nasuta TaxID=42062 RepID=UPI00295F0D95|nr:LOW QUALITY PROTEIN: uncharacterized protein LOC132792819 [Drosophila nasuta]